MNKQNLNEQVSRIKSMMGLNEEMDPMMDQDKVQELQNDLASAGVDPLDNEELQELQPDCPVDTPEEHADVMEKLKGAVESMQGDRNKLKSLLKQVIGLIKNNKKKAAQPVQEQVAAAPLVIAGVTIPPVAITIALGFLALLIVISLAKSIFGGGTRQSRECREKNRLFRRFGPAGVV